MGLELYKTYDKSGEWLRTIASSSVRTKIFQSLNEEEKDLSHLKSELDLGGPAILHAMKDLEAGQLVEKSDYGYYRLTNIGKIQAILLTDLIRTISVLSIDRDFWLTHDINGIPMNLLRGIGELSGCEVARSEATDVSRLHSNFIKKLKTSKKVKAVSPVFHPEFMDVLKKLLDDEVSIRVITNDDILNNARRHNEDYIKELSTQKNCAVWINDNINVGFAVTDEFLGLGLFTLNGVFDYGLADLVCYTKESIAWGNRLFEYYIKRSKKLKL